MESTPTNAARKPHSSIARAMLAVAGIALFALFCALGTWQVVRLQWKLDLIARVEQRIHGAPQPLAAVAAIAQWPRLDAAAIKALEYQPVVLQGRWLADKTVLTQAATELGVGFWAVTPLQLAGHAGGDAQVLVNRGFVPSELRAQAQPVPAGEVQVTGLLRASEPKGGFLRDNDPAQQRWYSRDVAAIAQAQGLAHAAPFFIDAGLPGASAAIAGEAWHASQLQQGSWPRSGMTQVRFVNNHLVYAITWYGLALMVLGAAWIVWRKR